MDTSRQGLVLCLLPQEVLNLIMEHVLHGILLEMRHPNDLDQLQIQDAVHQCSNDLVELNRNLELLKLNPPSLQTLLRHATFAFSDLGRIDANLSAVCHLVITREQLEIACFVSRPASLAGFDSLQTLTVREIMRAGANSATMRSVRYRLEADHLLQCIAGSNVKASDMGRSDQLRCFESATQSLQLILQLRVETWMPLPLTVSTMQRLQARLRSTLQ